MVFTLLVGSSTAAALRGGYLSLCHGPGASHNVITSTGRPSTEFRATCAAQRDHSEADQVNFKFTGIDLNKCIVNVDGDVYWRSAYVFMSHSRPSIDSF